MARPVPREFADRVVELRAPLRLPDAAVRPPDERVFALVDPDRAGWDLPDPREAAERAEERLGAFEAMGKL
ncbi:hypothetical protein GOARA_036_00410 [Gordonia araii NBRC 100433]|uniref:Uncharacterized protein n=1 Tax=Gordonia araii NBRC 100433 TaxID=1073574 RepID=G7H0D4_9ACTN|nr:hypothetical protein GOARA_036_00410 [Gordonia araii NBRC 100433]